MLCDFFSPKLRKYKNRVSKKNMLPAQARSLKFLRAGEVSAN